MCFLGYGTLRFLTIIFAVLLGICNMGSICVSFNNLAYVHKKIQLIMSISLVFDLLVNVSILLGIYGVLCHISKCIYLFICALICFFLLKIVVAKAIVDVEDKETELLVTIWYQFNVVFAGLCVMTATPFSLKLIEKETNLV